MVNVLKRDSSTLPPFAKGGVGRNDKESDYLVIGSGIAGLNFALGAAKSGTVAIVTKKELMESNSNYAQGGIATVLDKHDSFQKHIEDTLKAGCYLNDKKAVETMIKEGPAQIKRLIDLGVGFNRDQGELCLTKEGAHSQRRIAYVKDATGREIERALIHNVRHHKNISIFESHLAIDLIIKNNCCVGAYVLDDENKKIKTFLGKAVILATGGAGQVYARNCNPKIATGDGVAMAERAGAKIVGMEFIQFHPTALAKPGQPTFLISETVRGEGGILKNSKNQAFMTKYHPQKDLAPRDIVARSIYEELTNGPVYLDIRHRGSHFIKNRFPYIYEQLWWFGIKMDKNLIPVAPAAHYTCGGVQTDLNGKTNIPGLYAFGEVAHTGVHGANRLASNSLLECMVFSSRALKSAKKYVKKNNNEQITINKLPNINKKNNPRVLILKHQIQNLMWNNVGIIREEKKMKIALIKLEKIEKELTKIYQSGVNRNIIETKNLCAVARLITQAAIGRKKSIGCHYRLD
jgi:L-aspartate oxidase